MTVDQVREFHNAVPFQPFVITLTDGRSIGVEEPDRIAMTPSGRTIAVVVGRALELFDLSRVTGLKLRGSRAAKRKARSMALPRSSKTASATTIQRSAKQSSAKPRRAQALA